MPSDTRPDSGDVYVCKHTGLALRPSSAAAMWRIAKTSYGAVNPVVRADDGDRSSWGRYDVPGHRTIYAAMPVDAAYAESLANQRVSRSMSDTKIGDLFSSESAADSPKSLLTKVTEEWAERHHMEPAHIEAGWRFERKLYKLHLPANGWFIDICHSQSVATIGSALEELLISEFGIKHLTVSHLTSEDRALTTRVATWVRDRTLDDGSLPHGIQFPSKHGVDYTCRSIWLRATDDGNAAGELTKSDAGTDIKDPEHNPPLHHVLDLFKLWCY